MSPEGYGAGARLFHQIALSGRATPEMFFDIEKALHGRDCPDAANGAHVFVAGLARSGTTLLMRMLHDTGAFGSLTYRDMPLVMAPNLWRGMAGSIQKSMARRERAHGDGLEVDYDSPEALEEVFWRTFCGPAYIGDNELHPMAADDDVIEEFRIYVGLILKRHSRARYLSKNNNSILRLSSILKAFPKATILIPFRDPVDQALSLHRQHEHFKKIHADDAFSQRYMNWLVHHEFGGDHRRFVFEKDPPAFSDPGALSYWLDLWIDAYAYLLRQADALGEQLVFFSYERLIKEPERMRSILFNRLGLEPSAALEVRSATNKDNDPPALSRLNEAQALYQAMSDRSRSALS